MITFLSGRIVSQRKKTFPVREYYPGLIVLQNCVRLLYTVLDDLFFSKICFIKSSVNML